MGRRSLIVRGRKRLGRRRRLLHTGPDNKLAGSESVFGDFAVQLWLLTPGKGSQRDEARPQSRPRKRHKRISGRRGGSQGTVPLIPFHSVAAPRPLLPPGGRCSISATARTSTPACDLGPYGDSCTKGSDGP